MKGCISDLLVRNINYHIHRKIHSKNDHERSAKPHNTHPLSVGVVGNTVYIDLVWLVVQLVIVCDLGAQAAHRDVFLTAGLWGGQLAAR